MNKEKTECIYAGIKITFKGETKPLFNRVIKRQVMKVIREQLLPRLPILWNHGVKVSYEGMDGNGEGI